MKPPQAEAISEALRLVIASIYEENPHADRPRKMATDAVDCEGIDFHISACETAIKYIVKRGIAEVASTRRHRNDFSPINCSLPRDVLSGILFLAMDHSTWRHSLQTLAGVCRYWRRVIVTCPRFWTQIDGTYTPQLINVYLKRSEKALLKVSYDLDSPQAAHLGDAQQFIRLVSPHADRWTTFTFSGFPPPNLAASMDQILLDLQELKLKIWNPLWPPVESWAIPPAWTMRRLFLQNLAFSWSTMLMGGLHALQFQSVEAPSISSLLRAIFGSSQLQVLVLSNVLIQTPIDSDTDMIALNLDYSPTEFPMLKTIHLTSVPPTLSDYLLKRATATTATHVVLEATPLECFSSIQTPLMRSISYAMSQATGIEIVVREEGNGIRISTLPKLGSASGANRQFDGVDLQIPTYSSNLIGAFELILQAVGPVSSSRPLHLTIQGRRTAAMSSTDAIRPPLALSAFVTSIKTSLSSLRLIGRIDALQIFRQLSVPQVDSSTRTVQWACNQLKVMDLASWDGDTHQVVALVMQRWGGLTSGRTALPPPPKLEHLILPPHGEEQVQLVRHAAVVCEAVSE